MRARRRAKFALAGQFNSNRFGLSLHRLPSNACPLERLSVGSQSAEAAAAAAFPGRQKISASLAPIWRQRRPQNPFDRARPKKPDTCARTTLDCGQLSIQCVAFGIRRQENNAHFRLAVLSSSSAAPAGAEAAPHREIPTDIAVSTRRLEARGG